MSKLKPATKRQEWDAIDALHYLRLARDHAIKADTPQTLARIRAAIKSAEGAVRHVSRRHQASQSAEQPLGSATNPLT